MNILLVCACGASTSIVMNAMKKNLKDGEKEWVIEAKSAQDLKSQIGKYDVVLVAPQIRYQRKNIEQMAQPFGIQVYDIDPVAYGTCNGAKILDMVRKGKV